MAFLDKLGELARTAADKANDGLEINRINSDIVIQKGNINEYQRELGMYYWAKFVMGDQLDEEATAICDKIVKAQDRIKELEAEIEQVKADRCKPHAWQGRKWCIGFLEFCCKNSLQKCMSGWCFQHILYCS